MAKKGGLGRGLEALFDDNSTAAAESGTLRVVRIGDIEPNKEQPRDRFDPDALNELADSIRENGLLQPITVRAVLGGVYQIIAGERRWRACRMAGLAEVPVIVVEADDDKAMELALIENLQREDLTPLEEARGYRTLMERYDMTQEQVSARLGKSRSAVANAVRLLVLPQAAQDALENGELTAGHARVLAGVDDPETAVALCAEIIKKGMTVRQAEQAAKSGKKPAPKKAPAAESAWGDSLRRETALSLQEALGRRVTISKSGDGGAVSIEYFDPADLKVLAERLEKLG